MNKKILLLSIVSLLTIYSSYAQDRIWNLLQKHCGKSYAGSLVVPEYEEGFSDHELTMHIIACNDSVIYIPFHVGEDRSRTWVMSRQEIGYGWHHDHRHQDGSAEKETFYGGYMTNSSDDSIYMFPADQYTCELISKACGNVWWITMDEESFTYNLRRIGTDRLFTVRFDLTKTIATPPHPWGWSQ